MKLIDAGRVMTLVGSRIEWVLAMLACFRMGAVAMPCNPQLRSKDLEVRVDAAKPKLCIGQKELLGRYRMADSDTRRWVRNTLDEHFRLLSGA